MFKTNEYLLNKSAWGFNQMWNITDVDTMNFVLLSMEKLNEKMLSILFEYQKENGGFSTYHSSSNISEAFMNESFESFEGWYSSQTCVSAVSGHVLYKVRDNYQYEFRNLIDYLVSRKSLSGIWESYWWTSPLYATYFVYTLFSKIGRLEELESVDVWLKENQNSNGSYSDYYGESLFFSAFALNILIYNRKSNEELIDQLVTYILDNQFSDGSWSNSNSMRIPDPKTIFPKTGTFQNIKSYGVNVRAIEFQRLFTTVSCVNALYNFKYGKSIAPIILDRV